MAENDNIFILRFFDNDVTPESFSLKEIGELFLHLEETIKSIIDNDYPDINVDDVRLCPVGIENKSDSLLISTTDSPKQTLDALYSFGTKVQTNSYINLPERAYRGFKYIYSLAEKKKCKAQLKHQEKELFTITYTTQLTKPESVLLPIETVIYGELTKVGGENPRAWVNLSNGNKISFPISKEQVVTLGHSMLQTVGFRGKARWNPQSNYIVSFTLYDLVSYKPGNISNAFAELRKVSNGAWDDFKTNDDINKFLGRSHHE